MKYVNFAGDLSVSQLCMGTTKFGTSLNEEEVAQQMSLFLSGGGNFVDTAKVYGVSPTTTQGHSERTLGKWLAANGHRHDLVLVTKGCHPNLETMDQKRVSPEAIRVDLDESLINLKVDEIDLYLLHRDDERVPIAEILYELEKMVKAGKIRYYGSSNWKEERLREAIAIAKAENFTGMMCNQIRWSLAEGDQSTIPSDQTGMNEAFYAFHKETQMPVMAYSSMAHGYFAKRLAGKEIPESLKRRYDNVYNEELLQQMRKMDREEALRMPYEFFINQPFPTSAISSFSNLEQLQFALKALE